MIQNTMFSIPVPIAPSTDIVGKGNKTSPSEAMQDFGAYLKNALEEVNQQEQNSQEMSNKFLNGQVDIDQVMIASQEALLSLQFTTQVRNKAIEAYQEIMRTQI
ncbi:flagellar hook-basal body complex protein FliE [Paenibacillus massiliensis]|uniref:flagellar hook-basal body complex protein FliE n=1 Tax=Paenibacillus massiliensis TaxID=225917 RepID=UPI00040E4EE7|nr:flagellar hook-basal body complex protein FliE [Paenibacillus massiliensis]